MKEAGMEFILPPFVRVCWVSEQARKVWAPRFILVREACFRVQLLSIANDVRSCALLSIEQNDFFGFLEIAQKYGLQAVPLRLYNGALTENSTSSLLLQVLVAKASQIEHIQSIVTAKQGCELSYPLGIPDCCSRFYERIRNNRSLLDGTWETAVASVPPGAGRNLELSGSARTNTFWKPMGIRALTFSPCSYTCSHALSFAQKFVEVGKGSGLDREMQLLEDILHWPAEWSALHGISELKAPVLKLITRTDQTIQRHVISRLGGTAPVESAAGICHPYRQKNFKPLTKSNKFKGVVLQIEQ